MLREYRGDGNGSCGDPAWIEFVILREPRGVALEILQTITNLAKALECSVNCAVKFITWLRNMYLIAGALYFDPAAKNDIPTLINCSACCQ